MPSFKQGMSFSKPPDSVLPIATKERGAVRMALGACGGHFVFFVWPQAPAFASAHLAILAPYSRCGRPVGLAGLRPVSSAPLLTRA